MSINWLLLGAVVVYIGVVVSVGAIASKRNPAKDTKDMLLAGGQLGPVVLGGNNGCYMGWWRNYYRRKLSRWC